MKQFILVALVLVASGAWAGPFDGSTQWAKEKSKATYTCGFVDGYFDMVADKFLLSKDDFDSWGYLRMNFINLGPLIDVVDQFYADPANFSVSNGRAIRICMERMIARTPDGPRLLAAIGVKADRVAIR